MVNTWKSISFLVTLALVLSLAVMALPVATPVLASPGADYYVATTGDDSRTATQAQNPATPWKTISHAVDTVPAGTSPDDPNVIHVADGTYDNTNNEESFPITLDSQNVTLLADSTAAIIDQEFLGTGTGTILKIEATGITIDGFTLDRAGYGIMAYVGGFNILDNIFSNNTDHDISYGVYVSITGNDRNIDFTFDDILIDGNDFYITSDGVYIHIDLDFDHNEASLSAIIGDIDIFDNLFDMNTTDGVDIGFYVYDLTGGRVSIGDIDISGGNEFYNGYHGVDFYGDLEHFTDTTVTVGNLKVNGNYFEDQTNHAIYIDYYYCNDWDGTTTATFGALEINNNDIDSAANGIWVYYYIDSYDDSTLTMGNLDITGNNLSNIAQDGIYLYYSLNSCGNSTQTIGRALIQDNILDPIGAADGIYIRIYINESDSSQINLGEPVIDRNIIEEWQNGIYLEDVDGATVTNNLIWHNNEGIWLDGSDNIDILSNDILSNQAPVSGVHLDSDCGGNTVIHYNNIVANLGYGVYNNSGNMIDAKNNWWGSVYGPDDTPNFTVECLAPSEGGWNCDVCDKNAEPAGELGDSVSDNVDYCPWLAQQSNATIYEETANATATGTASVQTDGGAVTDLKAVDEGTLPNAGKPDLYFPHGFFSFNIIGLTPCAHETVIVTITLPDNVPVGTEYWKYHASEGGWIEIPMGSDNGDNVITITLVDGGLGDDDGVCDGVIVDQGAPGFVPHPVGVGGEAYPVNKLAILAPWLGLALLLIGGITWFTLRRRKACL